MFFSCIFPQYVPLLLFLLKPCMSHRKMHFFQATNEVQLTKLLLYINWFVLFFGASFLQVCCFSVPVQCALNLFLCLICVDFDRKNFRKLKTWCTLKRGLSLIISSPPKPYLPRFSFLSNRLLSITLGSQENLFL